VSQDLLVPADTEIVLEGVIRNDETVCEGPFGEFVEGTFPKWAHGVTFQPHALMLRQDVSAEELGIVEKIKPSPDEVCASVSDDPDVAAAISRWDRATPSTWHDLVRARLAAQERAGVPEDERAPLYSGDVEGVLTPLIMRMGRGDEAAVVTHLRRDCRIKYGEFAKMVLLFMLRTYRHGGTEKLLALATGGREAA
jgi:hypothetical protein